MEIGVILRAMLQHKFRFGLSSIQLALTVAILANCVSLIVNARHKMSYPKTFDNDNLIQMWIPCLDPALSDERRGDAFIQDNVARLRSFPGVRAASHTNFMPWGSNPLRRFKPVGSENEYETQSAYGDEQIADTLGLEIDEGRWFTREEVDQFTEWEATHEYRERTPDGKVREPLDYGVVVSRAFGERVFGAGQLVGKVLEDTDGDRARIMGVVRHFHHPTGRGKNENDLAVAPMRGFHCKYGGHFSPLVRAEPGKAAEVARTIAQWHEQTFIYDAPRVWLVSDFRDVHFGKQRMTLILLGLLIPLLLFVASLGVAGMASISITQRTRQIGIRRALGATPNDILAYFLSETGIITVIGLALGAGLSVPLNMAILRFYDGAKLQPGIVAGCALLLFLVALASALPPARRASKISPAIATRNV